jgi:fructokinase
MPRTDNIVLARPRLTVIGEALIDLVPGDGPGRYEARPGGSPFNVAVALARLGHAVTLMARLADNAFGRLLREHATAEQVDLSRAPKATEPTTLAVVGLDREARATYDFYTDGTADWQWSAGEAARVPADTAVFHMGSLASWMPPGDERIHDAAARLRRDGRALVSYDPNVRPALLRDPARARALVERSAAVAHLVKASQEDVMWLYEGDSLDEVSRRWLGLGALLVVITDGADGVRLFPAGTDPVHRPGRRVRVADTIGAGDAFTAGLLGGLARRGLHTPERLRDCPPAALAAAADEAVLVSALTCERVGADPPSVIGGAPADASTPLTEADLGWSGPGPSARHE